MGPNPGDPTRNNDFALVFIQGKLLIIQEAFRAVLCDYTSAAEFVRPADLDGLCSHGTGGGLLPPT